MSLKYKHSSNSEADWALLGYPVIVKDEIVIEKDTKRLKIGDGILRYDELPYVNQNDHESIEAILSLISISLTEIDILSPNEVFGLRISNTGIKKTTDSGATWVDL